MPATTPKRRARPGAPLLRGMVGAAVALACTALFMAPAAQASSTEAGNARPSAAGPAGRPGPVAAPGRWLAGAPGSDVGLPAAGLPAAGLAVPASLAGTGKAGWRPQFTPNPGHLPNGSLAADSCSSTSACTAVGNYFNGAGRTVPLAERWNGRSWAIQPTPSPAGAGSSQLNGVWCPGAHACIAAGFYTSHSGAIRPLAEAWNGARWSIQAVPAPAGATASGFFAVSCASASACTAVGDADRAGISLPLAERWNGTAWSIQATPAPGGATATGLFAVSCPSASACIAVGDSTGSTGRTLPLAEAWNGSTWRLRRVPAPAGASSVLQGVSCSAPDACTAAGVFVNAASGVSATLAERWNGTTWTIQATPNPAGASGSELGAVSCTSARACTAAGAAVTNNATRAPAPLAERWNGTAWTIQATPNPAGAAGSGISGVSCPSASACSAAGGYINAPGTPLPLAESWNGTGWRLQGLPEPFGAKISSLNGVSCRPHSACTAVGNYNTARGTAILAEGRTGTRWRIQPTPVPAVSNSSYLQAVACPAASVCIAVGYYYPHPTGVSYTLAEVRHGPAWSIQATPSPAGARHSWLFGVSCTSPSACVAVGAYDNHAGTQLALAERWNGKTWTIIAPATPPGATASSLSGLSCPSPRYCVAVGSDTASTGQTQPLAEAWNGTSWHVQKVPVPTQSQGGLLVAVSCTSARACTATGSLFSSQAPLLAERWNGSTWARQRVPNPPNTSIARSIGLLSVSCASARACVATGNYTLPTGPAVFAEAWTGTAWRLQAITLPAGALGSSLGAASCTRATCTAVGSYFGTSNRSVTLAVVTAAP